MEINSFFGNNFRTNLEISLVIRSIHTAEEICFKNSLVFSLLFWLDLKFFDGLRWCIKGHLSTLWSKKRFFFGCAEFILKTHCSFQHASVLWHWQAKTVVECLWCFRLIEECVVGWTLLRLLGLVYEMW
jgi:hypothetical protein